MIKSLFSVLCVNFKEFYSNISKGFSALLREIKLSNSPLKTVQHTNIEKKLNQLQVRAKRLNELTLFK